MPPATAITIPTPALPPRSLVLVTAANSLIASHATDALLSAGYRVRGAVRSLSRCGYLTPLFRSRHAKHPAGEACFELVEVPDVTVPGAWDDALKGVQGIAHVAGGTDLFMRDVDVERAVREEVRWQIGLLEAAGREGVRSVVWTSSAWAVWYVFSSPSSPELALRRDQLNGLGNGS